MRGAAVIGASAVLAASLFACNVLSGAGDLVSGEEPDGSVGAVPADAAVPVADASADAPPAPPPTCACVAPPPAGWTGPVALLETAGGAGPACPTGLVVAASGGRDPAPACGACSCDPPTGSCVAASVTFFGGDSCGPSCNTRSVTAGCSSANYCQPTTSFLGTMKSSGSCTPRGGAREAPAWKSSATACALATPISGACPAGEACAPKSEGATDARTCILKASDEPCPPGPYTQRVLYHGELEDTRSCSPCTCSAPSVTCSPPTVTLYRDTDCELALTTMTTGACASQNNIDDPLGSMKITTPSAVTDGGCAPAGGAVSGDVVGAQPTTMCCLP